MNLETHYLVGKRILFFSPSFFGYENEVKKKMENLGAKVDYYDERPIKTSLSKAILKILPMVFTINSQVYYNRIINKNRNNEYDYILIIKADMITEKTMRVLRNNFPNAKLILYLWDSIENINGVMKIIKYFDKIFSFDLVDCEIYPNISHRPLFFSDGYNKTHELEHRQYNYDIAFCGTIHSDRYKIIKQIKELSSDNDLKFYIFAFLQSRFIYYFYKVFKPEFWTAKIEDFSFKSKSLGEIEVIIDNSRITLDIQHPRQTGLTMRTLEMLGMNKKLITTNKNIKKYDFYNENNVYVIDRDNINIPKNFIYTNYVPIDEKIKERYSLQSWILEILY